MFFWVVLLFVVCFLVFLFGPRVGDGGYGDGPLVVYLHHPVVPEQIQDKVKALVELVQQESRDQKLGGSDLVADMDKLMRLYVAPASREVDGRDPLGPGAL